MEWLGKVNVNRLFGEVNTGLPNRAKNILCMTAWGLGDMVVTAPCIHAIKRRFPDSKLTVLTHYESGADELYRLVPAVDETIDIGVKKYQPKHVITFMLSGFWKILFELRKRRFDLVIVFFPNTVRRLLMMGLNCPHQVCGRFLSSYPRVTTFELLGIEELERYRSSTFQIPHPETEIMPCKKPPIIGIHPFSGFNWKAWPHFDRLQKELAQLDCSVVVVGKKKGHDMSLVNRLSIAELFWVISQCDVFVTSDSGPMHIAFALNVPTVALFPASRFDWVVCPKDREEHTIIAKPRITVDEVRSAVQKMLKRANAKQG